MLAILIQNTECKSVAYDIDADSLSLLCFHAISIQANRIPTSDERNPFPLQHRIDSGTVFPMATLLEALCAFINGECGCISITGSGGKTTALTALALHYAKFGKRVLVSTTTKLELPRLRDYGCDIYYSDERVFRHTPKQGERVFYACEGKDKALAPPLSHLETLMDFYDVLVLEADGARHKPLKLHSNCDPVVPDFTTSTLAVMGMSGWGQELGWCCFGWNQDGHRVADDEAYLYLLHHQDGVLKGAAGRTLVLCNQAENTGSETMTTLARSLDAIPIYFGSLQTNTLLFRKEP